MLDLRVPSGWFFLLVGVILLALGLLHPDLRAPLSTVNVNLHAGTVLALFGGAMLWLSYRRG